MFPIRLSNCYRTFKVWQAPITCGEFANQRHPRDGFNAAYIGSASDPQCEFHIKDELPWKGVSILSISTIWASKEKGLAV
jgi:hypothetical protein